MDIPLDAPDHTTLSRRSGQLDLPLRSRRDSGSIDLVIDSSGLAIFGEGEWAAVKHGGKGIQGWRKLHLGVDETGVIVAQTLTDANGDDASTGTAVVAQVTDDVDTVIGDTAYDSTPDASQAQPRVGSFSDTTGTSFFPAPAIAHCMITSAVQFVSRFKTGYWTINACA